MTPLCTGETADGQGECGQTRLMLKRLLDRMRGLLVSISSKRVRESSGHSRYSE